MKKCKSTEKETPTLFTDDVLIIVEFHKLCWGNVFIKAIHGGLPTVQSVASMYQLITLCTKPLRGQTFPATDDGFGHVTVVALHLDNVLS